MRALAPDFLFSFYYRQMLAPALLAIPTRGALNMHGSLLPKYRGRAPVNWAVLHGERETGATLHYMADKPDAGDIVAQTAVPILPDDTAREVFDKVTVAAEMHARSRVARRCSPEPRRARRWTWRAGSYFGGRTPEDGRIDWSQDAARIHNLVRAVAPPYPGAIRRRRRASRRASCARACSMPPVRAQAPRLAVDDGALHRALRRRRHGCCVQGARGRRAPCAA